MKFIVEVPDEQVFRGVPREGAAEYIARARAAAAEQARQCMARAIRFQTPYVPKVKLQEPVELALSHVTFEDWLQVVHEVAWRDQLISEAEANALGIDDPEAWRDYYDRHFSPADAVFDWFRPRDPSTIQPGEVQTS